MKNEEGRKKEERRKKMKASNRCFKHRALAPVTERERMRSSWFIASIYLLSSLGFIGGGIYQIHVQKTHAIQNASFETLGSLDEHVEAVYHDGVPNSVMIDGQQWWIHAVDHFTDGKNGHAGSVMAQTFCDQHEIIYIPAKDPMQIRVNITHEIFHAGACLHGGSKYWGASKKDDDATHDGIYHLGEFVASFGLSNPKFMKWLAETDRNGN